MTILFRELIRTSGSEDDFLGIFQAAFSQEDEDGWLARHTILKACYNYPELAPNIKGKTPDSIVRSWLKKYKKGLEGRISQRTSNPPGTRADPMINAIISTRLPELTFDHLEQIQYAHRLSMSAENILGLLLEEFLANHLKVYGWHCCWGEVIRHVDFCHTDGSLLQIKNRSNSENSSSSRVRIHQPIEKWHRIKAETGTYQWSFFNDKYRTERFSEEAFVEFVQQILTSNPGALAVEENNHWNSISKSLH